MESRGGKVKWREGRRRRLRLAACERAPSAYGTRRGPVLCDGGGGRPRAGPPCFATIRRERRASWAIKAVVQRGEGREREEGVGDGQCLSERGREDGAGADAKEEAEDEDGVDAESWARIGQRECEQTQGPYKWRKKLTGSFRTGTAGLPVTRGSDLGNTRSCPRRVASGKSDESHGVPVKDPPALEWHQLLRVV
ncbi:hypothetical protein C8F04DRAFT_1188840 [Mycena alexandri]|uniref:Uncharacterized protein n=1 Tax=Mycena alexandri TaxID=1745969 RepID=A0AAD6SHL0_9AGAR|nr:hypothetical protein C8F04DRAFT_1188840 [Mycena alexandri]